MTVADIAAKHARIERQDKAVVEAISFDRDAANMFQQYVNGEHGIKLCGGRKREMSEHCKEAWRRRIQLPVLVDHVGLSMVMVIDLPPHTTVSTAWVVSSLLAEIVHVIVTAVDTFEYCWQHQTSMFAHGIGAAMVSHACLCRCPSVLYQAWRSAVRHCQP